MNCSRFETPGAVSRVSKASGAKAVPVSAEEAHEVRRCLRGDAGAIRALVERFQGDVFTLCFRLLAHRHDAEDVTQETFVRVFRSLRRWDSSRPLRPWILAIAANRCRTWRARQARRPHPVPCLEETLAASRSHDADELLSEIDCAVQLLRPALQEAFVLYHEHGQSYDAIAEMLGRPVGTVKTWLHRARLQVLERLQRRGMVSEVVS